MAITTQSDSATIGTTEWFLASDSSSATYQTADYAMACFISFSNMAAGDQYRVRVYEKINGGTAVVIDERVLSGAQPFAVTLVVPPVTEGWEIGCARLAGTDRVISWSFRLVA